MLLIAQLQPANSCDNEERGTSAMNRRIFFNDLDCTVHQIVSEDGEITDRDVFSIIFRSMYPLVDGSCPRLLIELVKYLIISFMNGDTSPFIELQVNGRTYFRFSNDANLAMSFIPLENDGDFLMTLMPATEILNY